MEISGIIHAHSTYSYDGKLTLAELKDYFRARGLQFVCMTEHTDELAEDAAQSFVRECASLSDDSFVFVPGFEVPYRLPSGRHAHILMIGCTDYHDNYAPNIEALRPWSASASFVVLAHPVRNAFEVDPHLLAQIDALEVWNQQYEGKRVPRTRSVGLLAELRKKRPDLLAVGGVDFHRREHAASPTITLDVAELTPFAITSKLLAGAFSVHSPHASFYGTLPNAGELVAHHRLESLVSVLIIGAGKGVNALLAIFGLSFPRSLKHMVRRNL